MATKNVTLQVTSTDPSGYTYDGIYSDASYKNKLTSNHSYEYTAQSGGINQFYIKYKKSPYTLNFKQNASMAYTVSFTSSGNDYTVEVPVGSSYTSKTVELVENSANQLLITSIVSTTAGQEIGTITLDDATTITLPYSKLVDSWNGTTHTITVANVETTTTTTSTTTLPTTTIELRRASAPDASGKYMQYLFRYSVDGGTDPSVKDVYVSNENVKIPITYEVGSTPTLFVQLLQAYNDTYNWHSNKILYSKSGTSEYSTISIPASKIAIDTSKGNVITPVVYWDGPTTNITFKAVKDITSSNYIPYTAQYIDANYETQTVNINDADVTVAAITALGTSAICLLNEISTDAEIEYKKYSYTGSCMLLKDTGAGKSIETPMDIEADLADGYTNIQPVFDYVDTTTTTTSSTTSTTTFAPSITKLTSNIATTAYIQPNGQATKTVNLAANTETGVVIDMN